MARQLKACLNGDRTTADHPAVPVTPEQLAFEAKAAVLAGARMLHVHPRGADARESLVWSDIQAAVSAMRAACPGVPIGVSTRAPIEPDLDRRIDLLSAWTAGPDFASVNFHEQGAEQVADLLLTRGIGVEAGLFTPEAARKYAAWGGEVVRVLVEAIPGVSPGPDGVAAAQAILAEVPAGQELVVHGENEWAWPVLTWAAREGYGLRAGFEDMLSGPDGQRVTSNADLVRYMLASAG